LADDLVPLTSLSLRWVQAVTSLLVMAWMCHCMTRTRPKTEQIAALGLSAVDPAISHFLDEATRRTRFRNNWIINQQPRDQQQLAFLVVQPGSVWPRGLTQLRDNCAAVTGENTVACDATFLYLYLPGHTGYRLSRAEKILFQEWCIGHELGHLVLGDNDFSRKLEDDPAASQVREYRADCWFLAHADYLSNEDTWNSLVSLTTNLINGTIVRRGLAAPGAGIVLNFSTAASLDFLSARDHPEMLMRAVRLLQVGLYRHRDAAVAAVLRPFERRLLPDKVWRSDAVCASLP